MGDYFGVNCTPSKPCVANFNNGDIIYGKTYKEAKVIDVKKGEALKSGKSVEYPPVEVKIINDGLGGYTLNISNLPPGHEQTSLKAIIEEAKKLGFELKEQKIDGNSAEVTGTVVRSNIEDLVTPFADQLTQALAKKAILLK